MKQYFSFAAGITRASTTPNTYPRPGIVNVSRGSTRLDISELDRTVHRMYQAGLAPSTQRAYKAGKKRYLEWQSHLSPCLKPCYVVL